MGGDKLPGTRENQAWTREESLLLGPFLLGHSLIDGQTDAQDTYVEITARCCPLVKIAGLTRVLRGR